MSGAEDNEFTKAAKIAVRAGLKPKYPGQTEYEATFAARSDEAGRGRSNVNHSITRQLVENHVLRQAKYRRDGAERVCANLRATGDSEYRTNYGRLDEDGFKKHAAVRQDKRADQFRLNPFSNVFSGRSEYVHSFQDPKQAGPRRRQVDLRFNPPQEYDNPVGHRPYATYNRKENVSETHESHAWPVKEDRAFRYEWLNNKCN